MFSLWDSHFPKSGEPTDKRSIMTANRLLVIDDDPAIAQLIEEVAKGSGFEVKCALNAEDFRSVLKAWEPTAIILDLQMPETDGIELVRFLAQEECRAKIMMISGFDSRVLAAAKRLGEARGLAMAGTLPKPFRLADLKAHLGKLAADSLASSR
jgi:CheY-like chemotaxis protein